MTKRALTLKKYTIEIWGETTTIFAHSAGSARMKLYLNLQDAGYYTKRDRDDFRNFLAAITTTHHGKVIE